MSQPSTSTSASTALPLPNQQAPATSHPSWPRRRPPRGKTVPHQTPNPIPPGPITAPLFSDADPALIRVIIKAYGLPWDKLKTYLESQLNCDLSQLSPPALSKDTYTVFLTRELKPAELAAIEALRVKDKRQQQRIEDRPNKSTSRALDDWDDD